MEPIVLSGLGRNSWDDNLPVISCWSHMHMNTTTLHVFTGILVWSINHTMPGQFINNPSVH